MKYAGYIMVFALVTGAFPTTIQSLRLPGLDSSMVSSEQETGKQV